VGDAKKFRILYKLLGGRNKLLKILDKTSFLIENGLPIREAVESQLKIAKDTKDVISEELLKKILNSLAKGKTLSEALKEFLSDEEFLLLYNSEKNGKLRLAIKNLLRMEKEKKEALASLKEGATQPLLVLVVTLALIYYLGVKVLPPIVNFVGKDKLTGTGKFILYFSEFIKSPMFFGLIISFIILGVVVFISFPYLTGRIRVYLDNIFPYSIYREYVGITFLATLSIMVASGIPVMQALKEMVNNSSPYLKERVREFIILMSKGKSLGEAMYESGFNFPNREIVYDMLIFSKYPNVQGKVFEMVEERFKELQRNLKATADKISAGLQMFVYILVILITLASANLMMSIQNSM